MMRSALALMTLLGSTGLAAVPALAVEVRTCGNEVRTAPLNEARRVTSMVVQSFAVVNTGATPVELDRVTLELVNQGEVRDTRVLPAADVARAAAAGPRITALVQLVPSQFCNGRLLEGATLAKGPRLAPGEAVLFLQQVFVWPGARDALRISAGGASREIAINSKPPATQVLFPVAGRSFAGIGPSLHGHHRWVALQEFAFDIARIADGRTFRGKGTQVRDYLVYGAPVRAVADGKVVALVADKPDSTDQLQRAGESDQAYLERVEAAQAELIAKGFDAVIGNHVVIDHGNGEFSLYAHLKPGSITAKIGDQLAAGQTFAAVGSSGNSTQPHLHFQLSDCANVTACRSIPVAFDGIRLTIDQIERAVQSGDLIETVR